MQHAFRLALFSLGGLVVVGCTRAGHPEASSTDAASPIAVDAQLAEQFDAATDAATDAAIVDAATNDSGADERDGGARKGACARCRADQYCLVIHASGGVARPIGHTTSASVRCEPFPGKARSCASTDPATGNTLAAAGKCVDRDGFVRLDLMLNMP